MWDGEWSKGNGGGPDSCDDVGYERGGLHPVHGEAFRAAYEQAGGRPRLGCPRSDDPSGWVGPWAAGWRQDLRGGSEVASRIMALPGGTAIVMSGRWHHDYTRESGHRNDSGEVLGYPTSEPEPLGRAMVVRMSGGRPDPGLMVSDAAGTMRWLPKDFAVAWLESGGPDGPLGLPAGNVLRVAGGRVQEFERDSLQAPAAGPASRVSGAAAPILPADPRTVRLLADLHADVRGGAFAAVLMRSGAGRAGPTSGAAAHDHARGFRHSLELSAAKSRR